MTMYLPNPDIQPTGSEPAEYIDVPRMAEDASRTRGPIDRPGGSTVPLDLQTRLNITR